MKYLLLVLGCFSGWLAHAQLIQKPIYRATNTRSSTTLRSSATARTAAASLELPFWDDFSTTANGTPDSTLWAVGDNIYVNESIAKEPPTYKVASFDGLQGDGTAYTFDDETVGATDSLVSQPIDLSQIGSSNQSTVFLSFFYEPGGYGDAPDETDSLVLYFSKPLTDSTVTWDRRWSQTGGQGGTDTFKEVILSFDSSEYFHDQFQFKFISYASQEGPFDSWHLDYVYLNEYRTATDTFHYDRALTGYLSSLISPYYAMPAQHFFDNPEAYWAAQTVEVSNLGDEVHPLEYYYTLENLTTGENYGTSGSSEEALMTSQEIRTIAVPDTTLISIPEQTDPLDSQVIQARFYYKTGDKYLFEQVINGDTVFLDVDLKVNDTITTQYLLQDYYAYDDGVAEYAAGVSIIYGQVAMMYVVEQPDTLTHIDIYFPSIAPDSEDVGIEVTVWGYLDDDGIYTQEAYTVPAPDARDAFTRIELSDPVLVEDTIYIGYEQEVDDYLGIGLDKSNTKATSRMYYNVSGSWQQNYSVEGALMIRAVFANGGNGYVLGTEAQPETELLLYPNPTSGTLTIAGNYDQLVIINVQGQVVYKSAAQSSYNLSFLKDGLYLAQIITGQTREVRKLIIRK